MAMHVFLRSGEDYCLSDKPSLNVLEGKKKIVVEESGGFSF
jgi:hypothetical protein